MSNENILVTGGAGFIGSHVVRAFLNELGSENYRIIVVDDLSGGCRKNLPYNERVEFIKCSITNKSLINEIF